MWQMPDLDPPRDRERAVDVAAEHRGRQAVFGVVGDAHRFLDAADADDRRDRAEGFLAIDAHRRRDVVEHGRVHQHAVGVAAGEQPRALGDGVLDQADDAARPPRSRPPSRAASCPCADRRRPGSPPWRRACARIRRRPSRRRSIRSVDMQIWPWFMKAPKAAAATASSRSASSSTISGALPPSSSSDRLEMARRELGDDAADARRAGEVDAADRGMGDQRLDDRGGVGRRVADDIDDALAEQPASRQASPIRRCVRGQISEPLSTTVLPQASGVGERAHAENDRRVPRRDAEHDADRLAQRHRQSCRACRKG